MIKKIILPAIALSLLFSCKEKEELEECPAGLHEESRPSSLSEKYGNIRYGSITHNFNSINSTLIDSVDMYEVMVNENDLKVLIRIDKVIRDGCRNTVKPNRIEFNSNPNNGNFLLEIIGIDKSNSASPDTFRVSNTSNTYGDVQYSNNIALIRIDDLEMTCDTGITTLSMNLPVKY